MRVGIGLPNGIPGTDASVLPEWARRAEQRPFTSLGVIHRVAYDAHDPFDSLAAAAEVTERLRLVTMVVIAPLLATEVLSERADAVHGAAAGRLVLGMGVGARTEDYEAAGMPHRGRGERFDEQLTDLRDRWDGEGPTVLVGGTDDRAFARVARHADGYVHGGGPPRAFTRAAQKARAAWIDGGRPGEPKLWGQSYFVLGDEATVERARAYMLDYYAFTGPFAQRIAEGLLTTPQAVAGQLRGYAEAGCDELVLLPAVNDLDQVERLAEAL
ncbi:MAG TPA: LLM class flavin-dependent oxidoreductase [Actinomycetota bacterium]|jgi:alkanesulfonate monooxygenase SsuD/methylene tetrahydromethanopterin reductase-like flavin-dependent oxidoreductase (luciferase family)|nr:LLM class flavin-dependent oxidoreductase [Actinomycetota bacterium]